MSNVVAFKKKCKFCPKRLEMTYRSNICPDCQLKLGPPNGPGAGGMPVKQAA